MRLPRERTANTAWGEYASHLLHPLLLRPSYDSYHRSLAWLCLSQQPTFHGWERWGGAGTQRREMAVGGVKAPQPSGRWGKGPLSTRDLARLLFDSVDCPSICSLWRWRGSALRLFNSFSIFFQHWKNNFLKLWFKKKKKSFGWREGKRETPKAVPWWTGDI